MKYFAIEIDGVTGSLTPIENATIIFDEMQQIKEIDEKEVKKDKLKEFKDLQQKIKRAKIKIYKVKELKTITLDKLIGETND